MYINIHIIYQLAYKHNQNIFKYHDNTPYINTVYKYDYCWIFRMLLCLMGIKCFIFVDYI